MRRRNIMAGKAIGVVILLAALICWGCRDNQPLVHGTIHEAAKKGDLADVIRHLKRGSAVNAKDSVGRTPLLHALEGKHKELAKMLIAKGADVNASGDDGGTALHWAAKGGLKDLAELLISNGADVNAKMVFVDITPLHIAAGVGHKDIAALLIAKGADVNAKDETGQTPLHYTANNGKPEVAELLIAKGADVNARTYSGKTPTRLAVLQSQWDGDFTKVLELLKKHGGKE